MAIRGSLEEASLADVVQLLALGRKTGCLSVTHRSNFGRIYFEKGQICYATIVNRRDRLGDILEKNGVITRSQLDAALALQNRRRDSRVGELLVEQGALTQDQLRRAIRSQIEEAVYYLFTWTEGSFNFESDVQPDERDLLVSIIPESLLLEGARRVDEWNLIEKKIPNFDLVFDVDRGRLFATDPDLTAEQRVILPLIDGMRTVTAMVDASGLSEFDAGKALFGLVSAGFVRRTHSSGPAQLPRGELRLDERRNLGIAFYQTGMLEEALRELRHVRDSMPSDQVACHYIGLAHLREGDWEEAAAALTSAVSPDASYVIFHNLAYAHERAGRLEDARVAIDEAMRRGGARDPRVLLSSAVLRLLGGQLEEAAKEFDQVKSAAASAPEPCWFHYAALCAALRGDAGGAVGILKEGVSLHPRSSQLANTLTGVLERRDASESLRHT